MHRAHDLGALCRHCQQVRDVNLAKTGPSADAGRHQASLLSPRSSELGATAAAVGPSHRRDRRTAAEMREEARAMRARRVAVETSQRIAELHPPRERREASQRRHHQLNLVVGGAAPVPSSLRGADPGGALLDAMRVRGPLPPKPALFRDHIRDLSQAASVAAAQELAARGESGKTEVWFGWEERPSLSEQAVAGEAAGADGDADSGTRDGTVGEKRSGAKRRSASARTMTTAPASARERGGAGQGAKGPRGSVSDCRGAGLGLAGTHLIARCCLAQSFLRRA